jgi:hypothetical protein
MKTPAHAAASTRAPRSAAYEGAAAVAAFATAKSASAAAASRSGRTARAARTSSGAPSAYATPKMVSACPAVAGETSSERAIWRSSPTTSVPSAATTNAPRARIASARAFSGYMPIAW